VSGLVFPSVRATVTLARRAGFHCFAEGQGRFMLGVGFRKPTLTGFNARSYTHLWHRGASCPPWPEACGRDFAAASAPDREKLYGGLLWLPGYRDHADDLRGINDQNATVVSLENNAAVPLLFSALASRARSRGYMVCLQGQGALMPHPVCRHERPLPTRLGPDTVPMLMRMPRFRGLWKANTIPEPPTPPAPVVSRPPSPRLANSTDTTGAAAPTSATPAG
jgi:hypothetical protein